jgi:hypothetical protein
MNDIALGDNGPRIETIIITYVDGAPPIVSVSYGSVPEEVEIALPLTFNRDPIRLIDANGYEIPVDDKTLILELFYDENFYDGEKAFVQPPQMSELGSHPDLLGYIERLGQAIESSGVIANYYIEQGESLTIAGSSPGQQDPDGIIVDIGTYPAFYHATLNINDYIPEGLTTVLQQGSALNITTHNGVIPQVIVHPNNEFEYLPYSSYVFEMTIGGALVELAVVNYLTNKNVTYDIHGEDNFVIDEVPTVTINGVHIFDGVMVQEAASKAAEAALNAPEDAQNAVFSQTFVEELTLLIEAAIPEQPVVSQSRSGGMRL